jgi:polyhydroxybutyrate depolymerase
MASGGAVSGGGSGRDGSGGASGTAGTGANAGAAGTAGSGGTPAASCPDKVLAAGNTNRTLQVGGKSRSYVLHVPAQYTGKAPVPLIVDFHGHGGTGVGQATDSPYPKVVDSEGVLMAFPTAIGDWNMGPCCADDVDDIGFAKALVSEVEGLGCVDPKRIYATGFSMGGAMSHQLACQAADVFAAIAPAAFDLLEEHLATCKPKRPITVITFRGTEDNLALYNGGLSNLVRPIHFLGAINGMKKWAELDGCTGQAMDLGNNCQGFTASQCMAGVESIVCSKTGGGHEQGNATLGWPVLKRHQLP